MRWNSRRQRFRAILEGDRCIHPGSVFDPISARIAENLEFEAGMFAGSVASMTVLGAPDLILLTLTEFASQAHRISRSCDLPLLADADHGYGNALNVVRTVEELEYAGVAGLSIEDTQLPASFGVAETRLVSIEEGVGKMKAAVRGRLDTDLVIAGRTSVSAASNIDNAAARVRAYQDAGVDAVFLVGVKTRDDLEVLCSETTLPIILGGSPAELIDLEYLASLGVRVCLQGHQPFAAAVKAIHDTLKSLREGTPPAKLSGIADSELMKQVTREDVYRRWQEEFL